MGERVKGTDTILSINYKNIPSKCHKYITYGRTVLDYWLQKDEPRRTQLIVGGDLIEYPEFFSTPTYETKTAKIVCNSVVSTTKAK